MAIDFDIALYREKIARARQQINEKSFELATSEDPFTIAPLKRSLETLKELLSIYEETERMLLAMAAKPTASRAAAKHRRRR